MTRDMSTMDLRGLWTLWDFMAQPYMSKVLTYRVAPGYVGLLLDFEFRRYGLGQVAYSYVLGHFRTKRPVRCLGPETS